MLFLYRDKGTVIKPYVQQSNYSPSATYEYMFPVQCCYRKTSLLLPR